MAKRRTGQDGKTTKNETARLWPTQRRETGETKGEPRRRDQRQNEAAAPQGSETETARGKRKPDMITPKIKAPRGAIKACPPASPACQGRKRPNGAVCAEPTPEVGRRAQPREGGTLDTRGPGGKMTGAACAKNLDLSKRSAQPRQSAA